MANQLIPSLGSVIVIVLVARPVASVRVKAALGGGVGRAVAAQVPLAHHLARVVEPAGQELRHELELERQGVGGRADKHPALQPCKGALQGDSGWLG